MSVALYVRGSEDVAGATTEHKRTVEFVVRRIVRRSVPAAQDGAYRFFVVSRVSLLNTFSDMNGPWYYKNSFHHPTPDGVYNAKNNESHGSETFPGKSKNEM